jgi:hypothetical protein
MFLDGETLKVYLVDPAQRDVAERAIAAIFGPESIPAGGVQVLPGRYNFAQLKTWHRRAAALFDLPGVVFTDVDDTANRLRIGVEQEALRDPVERELRGLSIPSEAVEIVETEPIVQLVTLRDKVRPLEGGLQINFPGYLCTYGFNATRAGVQGFVINSHCTKTQGGVESTPYWQPLEASDTFIGTETADPVYTKTKCPAGLKGRVCRYSDSAFATLDAAATYDLGAIAKTDSVNSGSLNIVGAFRISAEATAKVGNIVNKVGRTTGWSQGKVAQVCVDTSVQGSKIVQLCQVFVNAAVGSGDSGSPAFMTSGTDSAQLVGILWGGNYSGTQFVYSPMSGIKRSDELGPLTTY